MAKADTYRSILPTLADWEPYLLAESGLPGPRGNIELAQVVADLGQLALFERFLTYDAARAPTNSPSEFLAFCGVVGLGRLVAEGQHDLLPRLRQHANDPRWRMREGVVMALQRWGERDMAALIQEMRDWSGGSLLEKRAAAAALCEPRLLTEDRYVQATLDILDAITASLGAVEDRRSEAFKALRKGLGYCWSVAVAASPEVGKPILEKWLTSKDKDIRWLMKQNLDKARLERMDAAWVAHCRQVISA